LREKIDETNREADRIQFENERLTQRLEEKQKQLKEKTTKMGEIDKEI